MTQHDNFMGPRAQKLIKIGRRRPPPHLAGWQINQAGGLEQEGSNLPLDFPTWYQVGKNFAPSPGMNEHPRRDKLMIFGRIAT